LKGDNRKHLGFHNQDGSVRMWIYKDKGGDGVRLNNGNDGGGEYVFHKDGGFRAPSSVYAGAARIAADGNIYGSVWGGYLSEWLHNHMLQGVPAGIPLPFPGEVPPSGWLKCNGQTFNKTTYPVLASLYPTGKLPDLRGEFIRGWDDGRKVDTGRKLLSAQGDAIRNMTGTIGQLNDRVTDTNTKGVFAATGYTGGDAGLSGGSAGRIVTFDPSTVVPTANENRPRNIAFNYIVRAA
ncbi:MAG: hypothetical protein EKE20_17685, partial [Candidatus Symbiopectobacterium sp. Dall1.0]|nr:hypothetical protein [Candidatus Symbiopectobacterium sp. Dall1.0]